jgi:ABC-type proline/glycine betaine transport system substrate-binding protein
MEYSITNSSQYHSSQDIWNCEPGGQVFTNGMKLLATNGVVPAYRVRALGTDEMIAAIQAATSSDQRMGYFYWSAANAASFTASNGKYLKAMACCQASMSSTHLPKCRSLD